jgi:hypothetical protein
MARNGGFANSSTHRGPRLALVAQAAPLVEAEAEAADRPTTLVDRERLKALRFHNTRHTAASLMVAQACRSLTWCKGPALLSAPGQAWTRGNQMT